MKGKLGTIQDLNSECNQISYATKALTRSGRCSTVNPVNHLNHNFNTEILLW